MRQQFRPRRVFPFLNIFLMLAILVSGLNPIFCTYLKSSTLLMEICSASGIKTIEVDLSTDKQPGGSTKKTCPYCLASHLTPDIPISETLEATQTRIAFSYVLPKNEQSVFTAKTDPYKARAPPVLL